MNPARGICALAAAVLLAISPAAARIKLTALPDRQRVEIQLDNDRYTLVEEERIVPLLKSTIKTGNNKIDFSWSNTRIDKNSIQFRPIAVMDNGKERPIRIVNGQPEVAVINVSYPPNENALMWEVYAVRGCAVKVRVSYLIDNLTRLFQYKAVANRTETELDLREFIQLHNYSGEDFGSTGVWIGYADRMLDPKSVGQQEDIKMLLYRYRKVPIAKTYTFDWYRYGLLNKDKPNCSKVLMHYVLTNDKANALGVVPLEPGKVRIYIQDRRGGEAFLGEDWGKLTPIGSKMRLYVGQARDIVCKRMVEFKETRGVRGNLVDLQVRIRYEIENFKPQAVQVDMIEQLNRLADQFYSGARHGDVEWKSGPRTSDKIDFFSSGL
ncbi:hypothetical protein LCGC14_2501480 [marine sediment metagenome]|uniref:Uncharacterized protein n=1 Tax=marine sediment metagenome TaxID=412755 RepID=A0A0F9DVG5_9ZZZZ